MVDAAHAALCAKKQGPDSVVIDTYIPKSDGSQRMLGIPSFEDKVAQRAVSMVLEVVYGQDFLPCSYGFRPGRSAHQALRTLQNVLWAKRLYWVLDIDIRKVFRHDSTLPNAAGVPRPTSHGRRHPTDDRQMAEGGGC
ncbi:reverse transcriptase/maturase family protein [Mesorhizobium opportunistum]|uniref:reverse transcriptase/maturase family protein n=1 Tax=Mesorhizobium opportunistum TaxID=593909 RepID=UPI0033379FC0